MSKSCQYLCVFRVYIVVIMMRPLFSLRRVVQSATINRLLYVSSTCDCCWPGWSPCCGSCPSASGVLPCCSPHALCCRAPAHCVRSPSACGYGSVGKWVCECCVCVWGCISLIDIQPINWVRYLLRVAGQQLLDGSMGDVRTAGFASHTNSLCGEMVQINNRASHTNTRNDVFLGYASNLVGINGKMLSGTETTQMLVFTQQKIYTYESCGVPCT